MNTRPAAFQKERSTRYSVIATVTTSFVILFVLLMVVFAYFMHSMLSERERETMRNQIELERNMLSSSMEYLDNLALEWASLVYIYDYIANGDPLIYNTHLSPDRAYDVNKLNLLAVLDEGERILFEKFYRFQEAEVSDHGEDLSDLYATISAMCVEAYRDAMRSGNPAEYPMRVSGYLGKGAYVYYFAASPVVDFRGGRPYCGTMIFGRIVDDEELGNVSTDDQMIFDLVNAGPVSLDEAKWNEMKRSGLTMKVDGQAATAYSILYDLRGDPSLLLTVENPRTLYIQGQRLIIIMAIAMAIGCGLVLFIVLKRINRAVLQPLSRMACEVGRIDIESGDCAVTPVENNIELRNLTRSVNEMLRRIHQGREEIYRKNQSLYRNANFDTLTQLRNRASALDMLGEKIDQAAIDGTVVMVCYIDLDRFKSINDMLGHSMGNELIRQVASRMRKELSDVGLLCRVDGDEFLICFDGPYGESQLDGFAQEVRQLFAEPFVVKERSIVLGASIGSSAYPMDGADADGIIKNAELAMYHAKESGKGQYVRYRQELQDDLRQRIHLEERLREEIQKGCGEFEVYFQPKFTLGNGAIDKCEALIRWAAPEGIILPDDFVPMAEESGLIIPLTWWLIEECCRQGKRFEQAGHPLSIAINIPSQVLMHEEFPARILRTVRRTGMDISRLDIEIIERTLLEDTEMVDSVFETLHRYGMEISVDDFGTGYSSLSYLNKLAVDRIKIDRSFVWDIGSDDGRAIVTAIIAMAKGLGITVTAEGVEDMDQYGFLREQGCQEIQGYLISKPLPAEQFMEFLSTWDGATSALAADSLREGAGIG